MSVVSIWRDNLNIGIYLTEYGVQLQDHILYSQNLRYVVSQVNLFSLNQLSFCPFPDQNENTPKNTKTPHPFRGK